MNNNNNNNNIVISVSLQFGTKNNMASLIVAEGEVIEVRETVKAAISAGLCDVSEAVVNPNFKVTIWERDDVGRSYNADINNIIDVIINGYYDVIKDSLPSVAEAEEAVSHAYDEWLASSAYFDDSYEAYYAKKEYEKSKLILEYSKARLALALATRKEAEIS